MNVLDWVVLAIVLLSVLLAVAQGFFFEVISLVGTVVGYVLAAWGYGRLAPWFLPYVKSPAIADLAAFLSIFVAVVLLAGATARIVRWAIREVGLRWVDRFLGGVFGLVRGLIVVTVGVLALTAFAPESRELSESSLAKYLLVPGRGVSWLAPSVMRQKFREGVARLRQGTAQMGSGKPEN
ncbi:MAG TPA: CvpA family protein [Candidatus Angelobacter sp.]|jgi:membrane protein required for colicin V production|nr:CvpA family protein [Candidatus Angelobacter sp.]